jgi:hypothetical protein
MSDNGLAMMNYHAGWKAALNAVHLEIIRYVAQLEAHHGPDGRQTGADYHCFEIAALGELDQRLLKLHSQLPQKEQP